MLSELLLQAEMELGSENSGLAESQTQKINRKREEAQTEKKALNSVAVTNAESVEEAAVSETSQTAESSLEKSVNVGVAEDKVSAQEEETLGKEAGTQRQRVSENEPAKQKQSTSGNEGIFFNQSSEGGSNSVDDIVTQGKKALDDFNIDSAYVKPKHLSTTGGNGQKFIGVNKLEAESILKNVLSNGKVISIADNGLTKAGNASYEIVIDAGKVVGTKGETLIKIVISSDGGMLSAYPIK
jgi:hypothetical protein